MTVVEQHAKGKKLGFLKSIFGPLRGGIANPNPLDIPKLESSVEQSSVNYATTEMPNDTAIALHPKILAIGLDEQVVRFLSETGLCIKEMDLGHPYYMAPSANLLPVPRCKPFPTDFKEHDIVVVDLTEPFLPLEGNFEIMQPAEKVNAWWCDRRRGWINTRLLYGETARPGFDEILKHGGLFVVFSDAYVQQEFSLGQITYRDNVDMIKEFTGNNYNFLGAFNVHGGVQFTDDRGTIINLSKAIRADNPFGKALTPFLKNAKFSCTFATGYAYEKHWIPLLENKHGAVVGALIALDKGHILLLPDFVEKSSVLKALFNDVFPFLRPELFPNHKSSSWSERPEYEISRIVELKNQINLVEKQAKIEIQRLQLEAVEERQKSQFLFDLVGETGERLVDAVQQALALLGFKHVIDADAELAQKGVTRQNLEDLQIHDAKNTLLIEIKGISGFPSDDDALAVRKYITLRMKEWQRFNVKGLTIINHQRNLPPLTRGNELPFRQELVDIGVEEEIGLMTGWDLHRLVRSFIANEWEHKNIQAVFSRSGRIDIVPTNYEKIGNVQRHIKGNSIIGIQLDKPLALGDRLGYELPTFFKEEQCRSMQLNGASVTLAQAGDIVGIQTVLDPDDVKIGMSVYRVSL